jgi:hypothetical protein
MLAAMGRGEARPQVVASARTIRPAQDPGVLAVDGDIFESAVTEPIIGQALERLTDPG